MSERFKIRLPDDVIKQTGPSREAALQKIRADLESKRPARDPKAPDAPDLVIHVTHHGDEYGTVTIHGSLREAKVIMDAANLKIMNLLRVEVPEKNRQAKPAAIAKTFDTLGREVRDRIRDHEFKKLAKPDDTMPLDTVVRTYDVAEDKASVVLHVDGNMQLTRQLLSKKAGLKLLGA